MIKVLVGDEDLDVHQIVQDVLEISFKDVSIEKALSCTSFMEKINTLSDQYNLVILNLRLAGEDGRRIFPNILRNNPEIEKRMVLLADSECVVDKLREPHPPIVSMPFSLDQFGEVLKKTCAS